MVKPWKEFRQVITTLYIKEGHTLKDVRKIMHDRHGFDASIRSYRHKFDLWDLQKYNCKKRSQRRAEEMRNGPDVHQRGLQYPSPPTSPEEVNVLPAMMPSIGLGKGHGSRYYDHSWPIDGVLPQLPTDKLLHPHYLHRQRYPKYGHSHLYERKYQHRLAHAPNDHWYTIQPPQEHFLPSFSEGGFSPEH